MYRKHMEFTVGQCKNSKKYHIHDTSDNGVKTLCKRFAWNDVRQLESVNDSDICTQCACKYKKINITNNWIPLEDRFDALVDAICCLHD